MEKQLTGVPHIVLRTCSLGSARRSHELLAMSPIVVREGHEARRRRRDARV